LDFAKVNDLGYMAQLQGSAEKVANVPAVASGKYRDSHVDDLQIGDEMNFAPAQVRLR